MKTWLIGFGLMSSLFGARLYDQMDFFVQSIPKGGTHLLKKTLDTLRFEGCPPRYRWAHFSLGQAYCAHRKIFTYLKDRPEKKKIMLVRDMRDVLISLMFYLDKAVKPAADGGPSFVWFDVKPTSDEMKKWSRLETMEQKLDYLLSPKTNFFAFSEKQCADDTFVIGKMPNTLVLRYEDLVGPNGGGTLEAQHRAVEQITQMVCRKRFDKADIARIAEKIYGGKTFKEGGHFRSGKTGEWRKFFKPRHIARIKALYNDYLLAYGYETSRDWD